MNAARRLAAMFEADRDDPDWFERFPAYQIHAEIGAKPWWPPLSQVWLHQGVPPGDDDGTASYRAWPAAWELLQGLYADYLSAKEQ
jgi:hypothetical protein